MRWSAERAGLSPNSNQSFNNELESIHYSQSIHSSLYRGRLRIGAQKFVERTGDSGGGLSVQLDPPAEHWHAHELIGPEQLIGFMVGDITPKAMMHLVWPFHRMGICWPRLVAGELQKKHLGPAKLPG
jgi:hypothetical protein